MLRRIIFTFGFVFFSSHALAEILPAETFFNPTIAQSNAWKSIDFVNTLATVKSLPPRAKNSKTTRSQRGAKATINKLVSVYSPGVRAQVKNSFSQFYLGYPFVEQRFNAPKNDIAAALTVYISGNYLAYRNLILSIPEQQSAFNTLYAQLRQVLLASRGFAKMRPAMKRTLFEQLAILGTFIGSTGLELQSQSSPDIVTGLALQDASRRNLEALFNVSADRIVLNQSGLVIQ